jgi:hypothetical protein
VTMPRENSCGLGAVSRPGGRTLAVFGLDDVVFGRFRVTGGTGPLPAGQVRLPSPVPGEGVGLAQAGSGLGVWQATP